MPTGTRPPAGITLHRGEAWRQPQRRRQTVPRSTPLRQLQPRRPRALHCTST